MLRDWPLLGGERMLIAPYITPLVADAESAATVRTKAQQLLARPRSFPLGLSPSPRFVSFFFSFFFFLAVAFLAARACARVCHNERARTGTPKVGRLSQIAPSIGMRAAKGRELSANCTRRPAGRLAALEIDPRGRQIILSGLGTPLS